MYQFKDVLPLLYGTKNSVIFRPNNFVYYLLSGDLKLLSTESSSTVVMKTKHGADLYLEGAWMSVRHNYEAPTKSCALMGLTPHLCITNAIFKIGGRIYIRNDMLFGLNREKRRFNHCKKNQLCPARFFLHT